MKKHKLLILLDRDGTIIELVHFLGKEVNWKAKIKINEDLAEILTFLQNKYSSITYVVSNQQGIARGLFTEEKLIKINNFIRSELFSRGVKIDDWAHCGEVDVEYVAQNPKIYFDSKYVKKNTNRKPSSGMVLSLLEKNNFDVKDFDKIIVFGDDKKDAKLAENINAHFIDVNGKKYKDLKEELSSILER